MPGGEDIKSDISSLLSLQSRSSNMCSHASQWNEYYRFVTLPGPSAVEPGAVDFWEVLEGASEEVIWSIIRECSTGQQEEQETTDALVT